MTKAENIFNATRFAVRDTIDSIHNLPEGWIMGGWYYGKTPEGQQFIAQRTLNDINKLVLREERRLDLNDKYGISAKDPERAAKQRETVRVLKDMVAKQQRELDREKEEREARRHMSFDDFMAKYYPQYC